MTLELNAKLTEPFFLFRRQVAFDSTQKKLMAHLMKVCVRVKAINRHVQTFDCVWNAFAPALEGLLYRNELIGESKSRNRMAFVNSKNDFLVFGIKHDVGEGRALRIPTLSRSALLQGVAFAPRLTKRRRHLVAPTLWAMFGPLPIKALSHRRASGAFGNARLYNWRKTNSATCSGCGCDLSLCQRCYMN
jgi:hypothetical protein